MIPFLVRFLVGMLIMLIVIVVIFALLDRAMKSGIKKTSENNSTPEEKPEAKPIEEPVQETKPAPKMEIYNSELADDLNEMLKDSKQTSSSRLQIENHLNKGSNIAKYIQEKNYRSFDFGAENNISDGIDDATMNREELKRIIALSHINDDKPL